MKVRKCPRCGSYNLLSAEACVYPGCGQPLSAGNEVEVTESSQPPKTMASNQQPVNAPASPLYPPGERKTLGSIAGGCLTAFLIASVVIALVFGVIVLTNGGGADTAFSTAIGSFLAIFGGGLGTLLILGCSLAPAIFWIWTIIEIAQNEPAADNDKIIWLLIVFFTNFIGALLYRIIRRPERMQMYGR